MFPRGTLQAKFILITSLNILVIVGGLGYFAASRNSALMYKSVEKQGRLLAKTVASLIINELIYEKLGLVEPGGLIDNYVRDIYQARDLDLIRVAVVDEQGKVLSHTDFQEYGKQYNDAFTSRILTANSIVVARQAAEAGSDHDVLKFGAPLSIGSKRWGALLFDVSLEAIQHHTAKILVNIVLITLLFLLGGFLAVYLLSRRFLKPITDLADAMHMVGEETSASKVTVTGGDEIAALGKSYNAMIDRIDESNRRAQLAHDKLLRFEKMAALGILASSVAHKINNPLGGLFNCVRNLEQRGAEPEFRGKYLDLIREGLGSIEKTVSQLLWSAGRGRREPDTADLARVLERVMALLDYRLAKAGVVIELDLEPAAMIRISPHDFQEVLLNLLINAIQAMPDGGRIIIVSHSEENNYHLKIIDTGCGIAQEEIKHIFEMFFTTKKAGEGTGLGLWMAHEIITKWKGNIFVRSTPGEGTTFHVLLPLAGIDGAPPGKS